MTATDQVSSTGSVSISLAQVTSLTSFVTVPKNSLDLLRVNTAFGIYLVVGPAYRSGDVLSLLPDNTTLDCRRDDEAAMVMPTSTAPDFTGGLATWPLSVSRIGNYRVCYYMAFPVGKWASVTPSRLLSFGPLVYPDTLTIKTFNYSNNASSSIITSSDTTTTMMRSGVVSALTFRVDGSNATDLVWLVRDNCLKGSQLAYFNISALQLSDSSLTTMPQSVPFSGSVLLCYRGFPLRYIIPANVTQLTLIGHVSAYNCTNCSIGVATTQGRQSVSVYQLHVGQPLNLSLVGTGFNATDRIVLAYQGTGCSTIASEGKFVITNNGSSTAYYRITGLGVGTAALAIFPNQSLPGTFDVCYLSGFSASSYEMITGQAIEIKPIAPEMVSPARSLFCEGTTITLNITGFGIDGTRDKAALSNDVTTCNASAPTTVLLQFDVSLNVWSGQVPFAGIFNGPAVLCYHAAAYLDASPTVAPSDMQPVVLSPSSAGKLNYTFSSKFYVSNATTPFYRTSSQNVIDWAQANGTAASPDETTPSGIVLSVLPCLPGNISTTWITPGLCSNKTFSRRKATTYLSNTTAVFNVDRPGIWHFCTSVITTNATTRKTVERILDSSISAKGEVIAVYPQRAAAVAPSRGFVGVENVFTLVGSSNVDLVSNAVVTFCQEPAAAGSGSSSSAASGSAPTSTPPPEAIASANGTSSANITIINASSFSFVPAYMGYVTVCVFASGSMSEYYPLYPPTTQVLSTPMALLGGPFILETIPYGTSASIERNVVLTNEWTIVSIRGYAFKSSQGLAGLLTVCNGAPGLSVVPMDVATSSSSSPAANDSDHLMMYNVSFSIAGVYDICHVLSSSSPAIPTKVYVDERVSRSVSSGELWYGLAGDRTTFTLGGSFVASTANNATIYINTKREGRCDVSLELARLPNASVISGSDGDASLGLSVTLELPSKRGRYSLCYSSFSGMARLVGAPSVVVTPRVDHVEPSQGSVFASCPTTISVSGLDLQARDHWFIVSTSSAASSSLLSMCSTSLFQGGSLETLVNLTLVPASSVTNSSGSYFVFTVAPTTESSWSMCYVPWNAAALVGNETSILPDSLSVARQNIFTPTSPLLITYASLSGPFVVADACGRPRNFTFQIPPSSDGTTIVVPSSTTTNSSSVTLLTFPIGMPVVINSSVGGFSVVVNIPYRVDVCSVLATMPYAAAAATSRPRSPSQQYAEALFALVNAVNLPCSASVASDALSFIVQLLSSNSTTNQDPSTLTSAAAQLFGSGGAVIPGNMSNPAEVVSLLRHGITPTPYKPTTAAMQDGIVSLIGAILSKNGTAVTPAVVAAAFDALTALGTTMCAMNQSLTVKSYDNVFTLCAFSTRDQSTRSALLAAAVGAVSISIEGDTSVVPAEGLCLTMVSTADASLITALEPDNGTSSTPPSALVTTGIAALNRHQQTDEAEPKNEEESDVREFEAEDVSTPQGLQLPMYFLGTNPMKTSLGPQLSTIANVDLVLPPNEIPAYTTNFSGHVILYNRTSGKWTSGSTLTGVLSTAAVHFSVPVVNKLTLVSALLDFVVTPPVPIPTPVPTSPPIPIDWWLLVTTSILAAGAVLGLIAAFVAERRISSLHRIVPPVMPSLAFNKASLFSICTHKLLLLRTRFPEHPVGYAPRVANVFMTLFCALAIDIIFVNVSDEGTIGDLTTAKGLPLGVAILMFASCITAVVRMLIFRQTSDYASLLGGVLGGVGGIAGAFVTRGSIVSCALLAGLSGGIGLAVFAIVRACLVSSATFIVSSEPQYIARMIGWFLFLAASCFSTALGLYFSTTAQLPSGAREAHLVTFSLLWCLVLDLVFLEPLKQLCIRWLLHRRELPMMQEAASLNPITTMKALRGRFLQEQRPPTERSGQPIVDLYATTSSIDDDEMSSSISEEDGAGDGGGERSFAPSSRSHFDPFGMHGSLRQQQRKRRAPDDTDSAAGERRRGAASRHTHRREDEDATSSTVWDESASIGKSKSLFVVNESEDDEDDYDVVVTPQSKKPRSAQMPIIVGSPSIGRKMSTSSESVRLSKHALNSLQATMASPLQQASHPLRREHEPVVEMASSTEFETISEGGQQDEEDFDYDDATGGAHRGASDDGAAWPQQLYRVASDEDDNAPATGVRQKRFASPAPLRPSMIFSGSAEERTGREPVIHGDPDSSPNPARPRSRRFVLRSTELHEDHDGPIEVVVDPQNPIEQQFSMSMPRISMSNFNSSRQPFS